MEKDRVFETVVGGFVLVVAIFFFYYVYQKSGWHGGNGYVLTAKFDRADGLTEGGDVKISGIKVGKIIDMSVDPESFFAVVKFSVANGLSLPRDSSASVSSDGLFGGKYLALVPGGDDELLTAGDEIENTSGPMNIESMIGQFLFSQKKEQ
ncbi:MAG: outer membrane lipid asymmetry maintenance protein MlaD [Holosporaceae bacterium]|jgi:phospholipid/cholesterol/gamma-HCH transport system substrate-binding protein|nr:outer membrane lipid asymmetry maintenance protein MlaD [Holosporaceae bacterium]